ncbi:MAG: tRNA lysidine(34) synthetase TilS [Coprococcus sp.]
MEKFERKVKDYINEYHMLEAASHIVAGVSGGADSVCLLIMLNKMSAEYNISLQAVHINHMIRGKEADEDEAYVEKLCQKLGVPLKVFHIDVCAAAEKEKLTVEEAGRNARYGAFAEICQEISEREENAHPVIAVAHNRNDVAETVLFNMARGSGVEGIKGISPVRDNIIRPLLCAERCEIERYLRQADIAYCTDSTNNGTDYTRNKIRHIILPAMNNINERAVKHIAELAERAGQYSEYVNSQAEKFIDRNVMLMENGSNATWSIGMDVLRNEPELLQNIVIKRIIGNVCGGQKDISGSHVEEVRKLYNCKSGSSIMLPHGAYVRQNYGKLEFSKRSSNDTAGDEFGKLIVHVYDRPENLDLSKKEYTKLIDYDKIRNDILLRNYLEEDYMVIAADGSKKKLNRLFGSYKIPADKRKSIPLVADGSEIIWMIGYRLSERYKVEDSTKKIMELEYKVGRTAVFRG